VKVDVMVLSTPHAPASGRTWLTAGDCDLESFRRLVERSTDPDSYPYASAIEQNVLIYDGEALASVTTDPVQRREVQAELVAALTEGPGVVVFKGAFADTDVVDRATDVFAAIIGEQHTAGIAGGDHFGKPGANDRVWNAAEKLALRAPRVFVDYYANDVIALVTQAWLGPAYQVTSQVNVVNPGGAAQTAHRDYHLGFMSDEQASHYPAHVHRLSPALTLQGAVAHSDMPLESGPTLYLPYSHTYEPGYLAYRRPELGDYFAEHRVQLPLTKGDAAFFNPAVFHGAGHNRSADVKRMANLLQMSSAFGRAMESVDRTTMSAAIYPELVAARSAGLSPQAVHNVVAASAEGYAFPTNLDRDQPVDGLAPRSQAEIVVQALADDWPAEALVRELAALAIRRQSD